MSLLVVAFSLLALMGILTLFTVLMLAPTADGYPIAIATLGINVVGMALLGPAIYYCKHYHEQQSTA